MEPSARPHRLSVGTRWVDHMGRKEFSNADAEQNDDRQPAAQAAFPDLRYSRFCLGGVTSSAANSNVPTAPSAQPSPTRSVAAAKAAPPAPGALTRPTLGRGGQPASQAKTLTPAHGPRSQHVRHRAATLLPQAAQSPIPPPPNRSTAWSYAPRSSPSKSGLSALAQARQIASRGGGSSAPRTRTSKRSTIRTAWWPT